MGLSRGLSAERWYGAHGLLERDSDALHRCFQRFCWVANGCPAANSGRNASVVGVVLAKLRWRLLFLKSGVDHSGPSPVLATFQLVAGCKEERPLEIVDADPDV